MSDDSKLEMTAYCSRAYAKWPWLKGGGVRDRRWDLMITSTGRQLIAEAPQKVNFPK
jgi:hypothetical protein